MNPSKHVKVARSPLTNEFVVEKRVEKTKLDFIRYNKTSKFWFSVSDQTPCS